MQNLHNAAFTRLVPLAARDKDGFFHVWARGFNEHDSGTLHGRLVGCAGLENTEESVLGGGELRLR